MLFLCAITACLSFYHSKKEESRHLLEKRGSEVGRGQIWQVNSSWKWGRKQKRFWCQKEGVPRDWMWDWDPLRELHPSGLYEKAYVVGLTVPNPEML